MKLPDWTTRAVLGFGMGVLRLLIATLRFKFDDRAGIVGRPNTQPYILSLWHNRLLLLPYVVNHFIPERKPTALVSPSKDGELLAEMIQRFGFPTIAGSSSRGGAAAVLRIKEVIAAGGDLAITPDGPRGPVYEINPGVVFLAQKTGAAVVPTSLEFSRCWRAKNWDRFFIPKPFSTVRVFFGEPHVIPETSGKEEFEAERQRLRERMMALVQQP